MSGPPWMKYSPRDFMADTAHLDCLERGAYIALINYYWVTGALPDDDERLARIVGLDLERWQCVRIAMIPLFRPNWRHKRIDGELDKAHEKSIKATGSAHKRWKKHRERHNANASSSHVRPQSLGNANKNKIYNSGESAEGLFDEDQTARLKGPLEVTAFPLVVKK